MMITQNKKLSDAMIFFLLGSLYTYSLCLTIMESTILDVDRLLIFLTGLFMLALLFVIFYNKYIFIAFSSISLIGILYTVYRALSLNTKSGFFFDLKMFVTDLFFFIQGYLPYEQRYTPPIIIFICFVIALFSYLSLYASFRFYMLAALGAAVFSINWIMDNLHSDSGYLVFLFCFFVFLCMYMNRNSHRKSKGLRPKRNPVFTLSVMPVCLAVVLTANFLPSVDKSSGSIAAEKFFYGPITAVNEFFYVLFNPKYFSFQTTGFSGRNGQLGGRVKLNDRGVMSVYADTPTYLAGAVRDVYTGLAWESSYGDEYSELGRTGKQSADFLETEMFLKRHSDQHDEFNVTEINLNKLSINIGTARTGTLFRPMMNSGLEYNGELQVMMNQHGDMRTESLLPSYTEYSYQYVNLDVADPTIQDRLKLARRGYYQAVLLGCEYIESLLSADLNAQRLDNWDNYSFILQDSDEVFHVSDKTNFEILRDNADRIYEQYTQLPDTLPQRVYDLAAEITSGYDNDYDKTKAIESYLTSFPYTLTPGDVPDERDFVDYFLFDGKEGYCTYYSSAMAILSRCAGLPSRYVEGYIMPPEQDENGAYFITNRQAHSWAEIYLEGFGWLPFEATAPFSYSFYRQTAPAAAQVFSSGFMSDPYYMEYLDQMGMREEYSEPVASFSIPVPEEAEEVLSGIILFLLIISVAVGCVLMYYLYIGARIQLEKRYYRKIKTFPKNLQAMEYFLGILKMTRYYHYPIAERETPAGYAARIGKRFAFRNDTLFMRDLVKIFYKAKFSGGEISDSELDIMESAYFELLEYIRSMRYQQIFLFNRYVLRII